MRVIKRYPNRKLYDTDARQYITLDELATRIRSGEEIHVVDHASGEDLTALTLTQIIFEQEKKQSGFLPRHILAGLIQAGGSRFNAVQRSLISSIGLTRLVDDEIERRIEDLVEAGQLSAAEGESLLQKLVASDGHISARPPTEEVVEKVLAERGVPARQDIQRLSEQIDLLAAKLKELSPAEEPPAQDNQR